MGGDASSSEGATSEAAAAAADAATREAMGDGQAHLPPVAPARAPREAMGDGQAHLPPVAPARAPPLAPPLLRMGSGHDGGRGEAPDAGGRMRGLTKTHTTPDLASLHRQVDKPPPRSPHDAAAARSPCAPGGAAPAARGHALPPARRYDPHTSAISGYLIDLDGTVYRPNSLINGAISFHEFLISTGKPFVYLSNTGAKGAEAVRRKLRTPTYCVSAERLPEHSVFTAAEAQVDFMAERIPSGAKIFVVSGVRPRALGLATRRPLEPTKGRSPRALGLATRRPRSPDHVRKRA